MSSPQKRRRSSSPPSSRKMRHTDQGKVSTTPQSAETPPTSTENNNLDVEFADFMREIGKITAPQGMGNQTIISAPPVITLPITVAPFPVAQGPRQENPFAGNVLKISKNFATTVHDQMHLRPTDLKTNHGVWNTDDVAQLRRWARSACTAISKDLDTVVAWKPNPEKKGGYNFLVDMGEPVGYVSGRNAQSGAELTTNYITVYTTKNRFLVSAFPCDPSSF